MKHNNKPNKFTCKRSESLKLDLEGLHELSIRESANSSLSSTPRMSYDYKPYTRADVNQRVFSISDKILIDIEDYYESSGYILYLIP